MEDMECLTSTEREENVRGIRDEIEALKAIYNNVLLGDEDKEGLKELLDEINTQKNARELTQ